MQITVEAAKSRFLDERVNETVIPYIASWHKISPLTIYGI